MNKILHYHDAECLDFDSGDGEVTFETFVCKISGEELGTKFELDELDPVEVECNHDDSTEDIEGTYNCWECGAVFKDELLEYKV